VRNVEVLVGDGALGAAGGAPYDRIIATVGAYGIPENWFSQLKPAGRLVVPVRLRGSISRSIVFQRDTHGRWRSTDSQMCGFMPLRGQIADDPLRMIQLTGDGAVTLQINQDQTVDAATMAGVLDRPRTEVWTGVTFAGADSVEWMYLWLTCALDNGLSRMPVEQPAIDAGLVAPMFEWGTMAVPGEGDLAYLARRPGGHATGGGRIEVGVIGHGSHGRKLAVRVAEQVRAWDAEYRRRTVRFEISDIPDPADPSVHWFVLHRPHNPITAIWE
jgi:protein-L-isoaspartate(D-aspartate) O-methyltransferase